MRVVLLGLFCSFSSAAMASEWKIGPYIGHQNLKIHTEGYRVSGDRTVDDPVNGPSIARNTETDYKESDTGFENSNVQGLRLTYDLGLVTLRSDLSYAMYYNNTDFHQEKINLSLGAQYNLLSLADFQFYSFAGLGLSRNQGKFQGSDLRSSIKMDPYNLPNYELGLGASLSLANNLSLVLDYKYSDALSKGESRTKSRDTATLNNQDYSYISVLRTKKLSETTQEITLGVLFSL
jgi:opacity protein-like surface antigen